MFQARVRFVRACWTALCWKDTKKINKVGQTSETEAPTLPAPVLCPTKEYFLVGWCLHLLPLFINVNKQTLPNSKYKIILRDLSKNKHNKITHELYKINWEDLYHMRNTIESLNYFIDNIAKLCNKWYLIKTIFVTYKRWQHHWLTNVIKIWNHISWYNNTQAMKLADCNYYSVLIDWNKGPLY